VESKGKWKTESKYFQLFSVVHQKLMSKTQPARGMRDFLPADVRKRNYVIGIIREVYESYGFEPLETPAVENLETLTGKYGEEGNQLMFRILKRGEKLDLDAGEKGLSDLALRYDLTVPPARRPPGSRQIQRILPVRR
jgi:histidyl-tRNA synthetase